MFKRFLTYTFFLLFFSNILSATNILNVEINGNERITKETIILFGQIDLNNDINGNELNTILKNLYETNFFEDIKLEINDQTLIVNVKEFPLISSLEIVGVKAKKLKIQYLRI